MSSTISVDADFARRYIEGHLDKRQVNKIQHAFPSPRFWTETEVPVREVLKNRQKLLQTGRGSVINLYVGVPYCIKTEPSKCGYCLFPVEDYVGNDELEKYFGYLKREAAMYKEDLKDTTLGAVYFGGGTSNLYKAPFYPELMALVRDLFPKISPEVDITLEGIPQLFTREKLKAIKNAGMNRISMGVQQINERLNALSGRKQTTKHVTQTLECARELGLSCNVDLIFGWPQQTVATMVQDLETVIGWGVYDITHYELNVGGPTDFALNRYHELPSTLSNLEMYRVSRDLLESHGFKQITAYNWRKPGDPAGRAYEEGVTRRFDSMDTLGLGYAAITFLATPHWKVVIAGPTSTGAICTSTRQPLMKVDFRLNAVFDTRWRISRFPWSSEIFSVSNWIALLIKRPLAWMCTTSSPAFGLHSTNGASSMLLRRKSN